MLNSNITISLNEVSYMGFGFDPSVLALSIAVILAGWIANNLAKRMIERGIKRRSGDKHAAFTSKKISTYTVYSVTAVVLLGVLGVPLSALGTFMGLIGLGLSFALRDTISNFIAGLMIMINRPFKVGDQIGTQGEEGTVKDIRIRATDIKTYDGRKVIVPNSSLYNDVVINNTYYDERRFEVIVGVGYDDDVQTAKELAEETLEDVESIEDEPAPEVLVNELGGSSVNLKLRGWTKPSKANMVATTSEVTQKIKEKYDAEGIDIPYPIKTVYLNEE